MFEHTVVNTAIETSLPQIWLHRAYSLYVEEHDKYTQAGPRRPALVTVEGAVRWVGPARRKGEAPNEYRSR